MQKKRLLPAGEWRTKERNMEKGSPVPFSMFLSSLHPLNKLQLIYL